MAVGNYSSVSDYQPFGLLGDLGINPDPSPRPYPENIFDDRNYSPGMHEYPTRYYSPDYRSEDQGNPNWQSARPGEMPRRMSDLASYPQVASLGRGAYRTGLNRLTSDDVSAIHDTATRLGISPANLTAIMGFETAGTMDPNQIGGTDNKYRGLIQFGPTEQKVYGWKPGMTVADQVRGPVLHYLADRGVKPGMNLPQIYNIVNPGFAHDPTASTLFKNNMPTYLAQATAVVGAQPSMMAARSAAPVAPTMSYNGASPFSATPDGVPAIQAVSYEASPGGVRTLMPGTSDFNKVPDFRGAFGNTPMPSGAPLPAAPSAAPDSQQAPPTPTVPPGPYGSDAIIKAALTGNTADVASAFKQVHDTAASKIGFLGGLFGGGDKATAEVQKYVTDAINKDPGLAASLTNQANIHPELWSALGKATDPATVAKLHAAAYPTPPTPPMRPDSQTLPSGVALATSRATPTDARGAAPYAPVNVTRFPYTPGSPGADYSYGPNRPQVSPDDTTGEISGLTSTPSGGSVMSYGDSGAAAPVGQKSDRLASSTPQSMSDLTNNLSPASLATQYNLQQPSVRNLMYVPGHPPMAGDDVRLVQQRLADLGHYNGKITGIYDHPTAKAVTAYQSTVPHEVGPIDGVAGLWTQGALDRSAADLAAYRSPDAGIRTSDYQAPPMPGPGPDMNKWGVDYGTSTPVGFKGASNAGAGVEPASYVPFSQDSGITSASGVASLGRSPPMARMGVDLSPISLKGSAGAGMGAEPVHYSPFFQGGEDQGTMSGAGQPGVGRGSKMGIVADVTPEASTPSHPTPAKASLDPGASIGSIAGDVGRTVSGGANALSNAAQGFSQGAQNWVNSWGVPVFAPSGSSYQDTSGDYSNPGGIP